MAGLGSLADGSTSVKLWFVAVIDVNPNGKMTPDRRPTLALTQFWGNWRVKERAAITFGAHSSYAAPSAKVIRATSKYAWLASTANATVRDVPGASLMRIYGLMREGARRRTARSLGLAH
jgi:hypothetical protein